MAGPGDLHALAVELQAAVVEALDTIPDYEAHLLGAPERQFISPGNPVHDCCSFVATWASPVLQEAATTPGGLYAGRRATLGRINHVQISSTFTRCIPSDVEPPVDDLTAAGEQLHADAWAVWNHLFNLLRSEQLLTLCQEVVFEGITPIAPSGGCAGWVAIFTVQLDGYEEVLSS